MQVFARLTRRGQYLCATRRVRWMDPLEHGERYTFRLLEHKAYARLGVIFYSYHTGTWWYEIVDLLRKLTLTGLLVFLGPGSSGQVTLTSVLGPTPLEIPSLSWECMTALVKHGTHVFCLRART